jgi:hypothetical protein
LYEEQTRKANNLGDFWKAPTNTKPIDFSGQNYGGGGRGPVDKYSGGTSSRKKSDFSDFDTKGFGMNSGNVIFFWAPDNLV